MINLFVFTNDLRLNDNPLLYEASNNATVVPIFVYDTTNQNWNYGSAFKWWLYQNLYSLKYLLQTKYNADLILLKGNWFEQLKILVDNIKPDAVYVNYNVHPYIRNQISLLQNFLYVKNIKFKTGFSNLLFEPSIILNSKNTTYKIFTKFLNKVLQMPIRQEYPICKNIIFDKSFLKYGISLDALELLDTYPWYKKLEANWSKPNSIDVLKNLDSFCTKNLDNYHLLRNFPAKDSTSKLSPHLSIGTISPHQIIYKIIDYYNVGSVNKLPQGPKTFVSELIWREFSHYLLYHNPQMTDTPINTRYINFPWNTNVQLYKAWCKGLTGYPIVDAGMRQLWESGWMHNRVRMIVASFLIKNGLQNWLNGAKWFWDTLIDADIANNSQNWQWVCGCGVDPMPYFRIFNPTLQSKKFDPQGTYIQKWIPELKHVDTKYIHEPWTIPSSLFSKYKLKPNIDYPLPLIDYNKSKNIFLMYAEKYIATAKTTHNK